MLILHSTAKQISLLQHNLLRTFHRFLAVVAKDEKPVDLSDFDQSRIRNFSIVAHIDHGKSTLADGLLEHTKTIVSSALNAQVLDKLRVERERGITVKAQTASMFYDYKGRTFLLNLIDTPGHVDFSYEVSRSLAACQGALLLVDASQGVEAQTVANFWLAFEQNLNIIGVMNKIDMPHADQPAVEQQMQKLFEMRPSEILRISAKLRTGMPEVLNAVVDRIAAPTGDPAKPLKAFVFDSWFEKYKGCLPLVLVKDGILRAGDEVCSLSSGKKHQVQQVGVLRPDPKPATALYPGQVGFFSANLRNVGDVLVGDTFCHFQDKEIVLPLPGFKMAKPVVFAGLYPVDNADYDELRVAVERLCLNDPSVHLEPVSSPALGLGWRVGFLGVLHMEVFTQRLEDEYDAQTILTAPTVAYLVRIKDNDAIRRRYESRAELLITDPSDFPQIVTDVEEFLEPMAICTIITPLDYYKAVEDMCGTKRGEQRESSMIDDNRIMMRYRFPLSEIIVNFVDELKRISSGYASFDYELDGYQGANLVKLNIALNNRIVEEFSSIVLEHEARHRGKELCRKLANEIPHQLFEINITASTGSSRKLVAKETIKAFTKSYASKLKGNMDISRLGKLLARQKEGKLRMKTINQVPIPKEAFLKVLRR